MEQNQTPSEIALSLPSNQSPVRPTLQRHDGWSPDKQRRFCEALADCGRVQRAAGAVGMDVSSAYRLRRSPKARDFAIAWDAALLLAQQRLVDEAIDLAFEGTKETITRDGEIVAERSRRDSRVILTTLAKLKDYGALNAPATQIVAQDFDGFLDRIGGGEGAEETSLADYLALKSGKRVAPPRDCMGRFRQTAYD